MGRRPVPAAPDPEELIPRKRDVGTSRQHYFKEVECFDCRTRFKVGRSARSANCTSCGALLCLEDVEVNVNSTESIRTRGDVLIRKNGNVQAAEVRCRDLKLFGVVSAAIECSGEFYARATGTIIGELRCQRLVIDKESDIHFMNSIFAAEVVVRGRVLGHIQCTGSVSISATGLVQGDVKARAVSIEPGGQLDGTMNIVQAPSSRDAASAARNSP
jgi:cytoskeletal protein CcmA (bactofilin family)/ribosomal protein S27E